MEFDDFGLMAKGFFDKRKRDELNFARVGFYIAAIHQNGLAGKTLSSKQFYNEWFGNESKPLPKEELRARSKEIMDRVKFTNKILEEKQKIKKGGKRT